MPIHQNRVLKPALMWHRRSIICLRPVVEGDAARLEILLPHELTADLAGHLISEQHVAGYQICLYDDELYSELHDRSRLDSCIDQFRAAMSTLATSGNRLCSNGFAFLWKDRWSESLAPYSITVLHLAPFSSLERFLHTEKDLPPVVQRLIQLVASEDPSGTGDSLWKVAASGMRLLESVCSPRCEGYSDWRSHRSILDQRADNIAFVGWGIFGDALCEQLLFEYQSGNTNVSATDPALGMSVVERLVTRDYNYIDIGLLDFWDEPE